MAMKIIITLILTLLFSTDMNDPQNGKTYEEATFGAGCFWCTEAIYDMVDGIVEAEAGFSGGEVTNPSDREVVSGKTGHAEVARIKYDPEVISYEELLEIFWHTHNPTTLNRQGADIGTQYRSVIFYHNDEQKRIAEDSKNQMNRSGYFNKPIVTAIEPYKNFFVAEENHQNFYKNNSNQPYCRFRIDPKMDKLQKQFNDLLK